MCDIWPHDTETYSVYAPDASTPICCKFSAKPSTGLPCIALTRKLEVDTIRTWPLTLWTWHTTQSVSYMLGVSAYIFKAITTKVHELLRSQSDTAGQLERQTTGNILLPAAPGGGINSRSKWYTTITCILTIPLLLLDAIPPVVQSSKIQKTRGNKYCILWSMV